jgi:HEPN domain-containing protein
MKKATKSWLDFAHRDLEAAKILVDNEYVSNVVLFHSQQCVEKCLKALLEENGVPVPHRLLRFPFPPVSVSSLP